MKSLKDQLLKAGLADKQVLRKEGQRKSRGPTKAKSDRRKVSEITQDVAAILDAKAARDRELNLERQRAADKKAALAQLRQMVESSEIQTGDGEIAYNFSHGQKIKTIYVDEVLHAQLSKGQIAIVCLLDESYQLVPRVVGEKVAALRDDFLIQNSGSEIEPDADDPYADYQIPDDLVW